MLYRNQDPGLNFDFGGKKHQFYFGKITPIEWICEVNRERGGRGSYFVYKLEEKTSRGS